MADHSEHDHKTAHGNALDHAAADGFEAFSFQSDQPFAVREFQDFLERLPDTVYRAKGLLWLDGSDTRYIFHLVAKRFCLDESPRLGPMQNKLVLIGRTLDREQLRSELRACLVPPACGNTT